MRLCAVSVDLDEIPNYFGIHGLPEPQGPSRTLVYDVGVGRLRDFAKAAGLPLTLFAIGSDLARPESARALKAARDEGHEMANHTLDHPYDLVRLGRDGIRAQIEGGARIIAEATGEMPVGFRAPGYTITDEVFSVLDELGVAYDSSVFPCPAYYGAKVSAIGWIAMRGRTSRSVMDTPAVLLAPTHPYRVGTPYWRQGRGLLELPIQVTRGLRLPYFGTTVTMGGPSRARWLTKMCVGAPLVNLELHGIDVLDEHDGLQALASYTSTGVRVPVATKLAGLHAAVETLRDAGYAFVTLRDAATRVAVA